MQADIGSDNITHENIKAFLWRTLKSGQVVPGYCYLSFRLSGFSANMELDTDMVF